MSRTFRCRPAVLVALAAWALSSTVGCFSSTPKQDWSKLLEGKQKSSPKPAGKPLLGVAGQSLGESQEVSLAPEQLLGRVRELTQASQPDRAARVVQRHPDGALELLRSNAAGDDRAAELLAAAHDAHCVAADGLQTWSALLASRRADAARFREYDDARSQFKNSLSGGHAAHALRSNLTALASGLQSPLLEIDAAYLVGTAHLLNDQPAEAAAAFLQAANLADRVSRYQAVYALLPASDAQRRAGDAALASQTWQSAVELATSLLTSEQPVHDPVLWERLGYLRPVERAWPEEAVAVLQTLDPLPGLDLPEAATGAVASDRAADPAAAEAVVWNAIGSWYLDRGQAQAALVSFKRAETSAPENESRPWLRFRQARALAQLDQTGPATAVLMALAADKQGTASPAAMGLLGSLRIKSGQVQQGFGLLRKSIESNPGVDWPGRTQAEADLGLAYLMMGDEPAGLRRLHEAQSRFEAAGDRESLTLSLENEAAYLDNAKKRSDAAAVRKKLKALEAR